MTRWFCDRCQSRGSPIFSADTYVVVDEEVSDDFVSMSSREVHCASHVERPAGIQRHQGKSRRTIDSSIIVPRRNISLYLRCVSSGDVSRRRVWENVDDIAALQLFSDISERSDW
jgi:hypothetical protein